jgi:hypothetical protein
LKKQFIAFIIILLVVTPLPSLYISTALGETTADTSIQTANASINQAFTNILAAEKGGADVTQLLSRLNDAGGLLAEAENAYQTGDLSNVNSKADSASLIAVQVNSDAVALLSRIDANSRNEFVTTLLFSIISIVVFLIVLALVWRRFKRGYYKKLLDSKPEVINDAD